MVPSISAETVRRILRDHRLKPWRVHSWCSAGAKPDPELFAKTAAVADLYTRTLVSGELVLSLDEKTSLQPRPRFSASKPAAPGEPCRFDDRYRRAGALNLFAAFDTRTGRVCARTSARKTAADFVAFLDQLDAELPAEATKVHIVLDNLSVHKSAAAEEWLARHPRFEFHFSPARCSWMNQVEQWFSILARKRFRLVDFADVDALAERLHAYVAEWNAEPHPFNWTTESAAKVMAWAERKSAA